MPGRMDPNEESQSSTGARTHRPESRASSNSRFTPQSSNSSSANLQNRNQVGIRERERTQDRVPSSDRREPIGGSLLQERLREKKAARLSERRRSTDVDTLMEEGVGNSSPRNGASSRAGRDREGRPGSSGERTVSKKGMGIKEMEDAVSTLHKQNFDLKLELYHRRERQATLEERLEAAEALIAEQAEMQAVNEQLLAELEKRDQAVEEAVGIICALEERIDRMSEEYIVKSTNPQYETGYFQRSHQKHGHSRPDPSTTSPHHNGRAGDTSTQRPKHSVGSKPITRMPSFLSEQSEGAEALRSLYLPNDQQSPSLLSLPQLQEEVENKDEAEDIRSMDSPRLSVLSESSFLSVYGEKSLAIESLDLVDGGPEVASPARGRHRKSLSIERWVDERTNAAGSTIRRPSAPRSHSTRSGQFPSINNILESPLQRLEKLERTLSKHNGINASASFPTESVAIESRNSGPRQGIVTERDVVRKTEMTTFEHQQALPPTPDTISTSTLRRFKNSNDTLGRTMRDQVRDGEQEQAHHPNNGSTYSIATSARPHSAGETVTSRREGHGWDTVTQSEYTETHSDEDIEVSSTFDPWIAMGREKPRPRIQPPDMFTFGSDDSDHWGRDMMFNRDSSSVLPRLRNREYGATGAEDPRSEDTVTATPRLERTQSANDSSPYPSSGASFTSQPVPNPPERRSSLAHSPTTKDKKQRKAPASVDLSGSRPPTQQAPTVAITNAIQAQANSKRYRITSKIFGLGRSESQPNPPLSANTNANSYASGPTNYSRSKSLTTATDIYAAKRNSTDAAAAQAARATPPPILRYPIRRDGVGVRIVRPTSASSLDSKVHGRGGGERCRNVTALYDDGFGVDGAGDERSERGWRNGRNGVASTGVGASMQGNLAGAKVDNKSQHGGRKWFGLGRSGSLRR